MNFSVSSQRKSWIFSQESINSCRERALSGERTKSSCLRPQKFASGFHARQVVTPQTKTATPTPSSSKKPILSIRDQETLVQFHAHQIQSLVGPYAILPELRRSQKVLSTAIILFRRFFLSNSVVEFNPRKIATAAAFFAAKVEEEKIEVGSMFCCFRHCRRDCWMKNLDGWESADRTFSSICKFYQFRTVIDIESLQYHRSCMGHVLKTASRVNKTVSPDRQPTLILRHDFKPTFFGRLFANTLPS